MEKEIISTINSQERLSGALSYVFFLIPAFMKKKTDFTVFHMRQSFLLFFVFVIASFIPLIGGLVSFVAFCHLIFLAWKAYSGEKFKISYIYDTSVRMTQEFGLEGMYSLTK